MKIWRRRHKIRCCCHNKVNVPKQNKRGLSAYLHRERLKPDPGDLTLGEYMEKILQYGYLMVRIMSIYVIFLKNIKKFVKTPHSIEEGNMQNFSFKA